MMTLSRTLNGELDRLWTDMMRPLAVPGTARAVGGPEFLPAVDIHEAGDALVIEADVPGLRAEDLKVSVENGVLTIAGERKEAKVDHPPTYHRTERTWGAFERRFQLPRDIGDQIEAAYEHGVLTVKLAKRPEARSRQIEVKAR